MASFAMPIERPGTAEIKALRGVTFGVRLVS
jgi:hypothetical protein